MEEIKKLLKISLITLPYAEIYSRESYPGPGIYLVQPPEGEEERRAWLAAVYAELDWSPDILTIYSSYKEEFLSYVVSEEEGEEPKQEVINPTFHPHQPIFSKIDMMKFLLAAAGVDPSKAEGML